MKTGTLRTQVAQPHVMNFPASSDALYVLAPDVTKGTIHDQISARLAQLNAMLAVLYGDTGEAFQDGLSESLKSNYMWACSAAAMEVQELFSQLTAREVA